MMSLETLIVGRIRFKLSFDNYNVIKNFENVLECSIINVRNRTYRFQHINWDSHVRGGNIKEIIERYKDIIELIDVSIYYLGEPDEQINFNINNEYIIENLI
ncbi:MAG: hypothetical protein ACUVWP_06830, partial [bacterium]